MPVYIHRHMHRASRQEFVLSTLTTARGEFGALPLGQMQLLIAVDRT